MDSSHHEDIVEEYLSSLETNTPFEWERVPDDPELLSVLKMTREMWANTHSEARGTFCDRVEKGLQEMMIPRVELPKSVPWYHALVPVIRYASVGLVGILAVVVIVNAMGGSPIVSNPFSSSNSSSSGFLTADRKPKPSENSNFDNSSSDQVASNETDNTPSNAEEPEVTPSVNTSSAAKFLDVSDLDPDDQMNTLVSDFSTDFSEMLDDVNDDGLARMGSDIQLVSF
ncbi:MAG: hypothetical protein HYZ08_03110 [Candidatus Kerfeldbacteria bacterium]|nr:hypothetical protein [Candidatus Kerfeldbacteria bacterium]